MPGPNRPWPERAQRSIHADSHPTLDRQHAAEAAQVARLSANNYWKTWWLPPPRCCPKTDADRPAGKYGAGGRIDLLALEPDSSLVLIEIKRDRTPRELGAQALDTRPCGAAGGSELRASISVSGRVRISRPTSRALRRAAGGRSAEPEPPDRSSPRS